MFPKVVQIDCSAVFTKSNIFKNIPISRHSFRATFVNKFVAKNFLKSSNLVTLLVT